MIRRPPRSTLSDDRRQRQMCIRDRIWDATKMNPNTIMPPFGRQQILSEGDIDKIVEYVYTL